MPPQHAIITRRRKSALKEASFAILDSDEEEEELLLQQQQAHVKRALLESTFNASRRKSMNRVPWLRASSSSARSPHSSRPTSPGGPQLDISSTLRSCPAFNDQTWSMVNGNLCMELALEEPNLRTVALGFNQLGNLLVSATNKGLITLWDTASAQRVNSVPMKVDDGKVECCVLSPCGTTIAAGTSTGRVLVWKISGDTSRLILNEKVHSPKLINRMKLGVAKVAVSNDSRHIGTAGHDGLATIWSVGDESCTKIMEGNIEMPGKTNGLLCIAFANNNRIAVACGGNGSVLVLDINTLKTRMLVHKDIVHRNEVMLCLSISYSSKYVATCSTEGSAYLWSLDDDETSERFKISTAHLHSCVLDPDEEEQTPMRLVVGTDEGKVCMINLLGEKRGNQLGTINTIVFGTGAVRHVSFSRDSRLILAAGNGDNAVVLDADQMALLYKLEPVHNGSCHLAAEFSPGSTRLAVALDEAGQGSVVIWDITSGAAATMINARETVEEDSELDVSFGMFTSSSSKDLVHSTSNGTLQIWNSGHFQQKLIGMPAGMASAFAISPCNSFVAAGTRDGNMYAWDVSQHNPNGDGHIQAYLQDLPLGMSASKIELSRGGKYFAAYKPRSGSSAVIGVLEDICKPTMVEWSGSAVHSIKFMGEGQKFVICGDLPRIEIWKSGPKPEMLHHLEAQAMPGGMPYGFVDCDAFSDNSGAWVIAAVSEDGHMCIWEGEGDGGCRSLNVGHYVSHAPEKCKFSPDGSRVVTFGLDGTVAIWPRAVDLQAKTQYTVMGRENLYSMKVNDVAWSFDSQMIVCCGQSLQDDEQNVAYVFQVEDNTSPIAELVGADDHPFVQASFSPGNELVALTREDGKVAVYNRAAARGMQVTDISVWYNSDRTGMRTEAVVAALEDYPQSANHTNSMGHNLFTVCAMLSDCFTLEKVIDMLPNGMGLYSFTGVNNLTPSLQLSMSDAEENTVPDALDMAIQAKDEGLIYDLMMAVADGKATHRSANSIMSHWASLCDSFPTMVFVFLAKLGLEEVETIKFQDTEDLLADSDTIIVHGSQNYEQPDGNIFWREVLYPHLEAKKAEGIPPQPTRPAGLSSNTSFSMAPDRGNTVMKMANDQDMDIIIPRPSVSSRLTIPFAVLPQKQGMLKPLVESNVPCEAFGTPAIRAIIDWKWKAFAGRAFGLEICFHLAQLVFFTSFSIMFSFEPQTPCDPNDSNAHAPYMIERSKDPLVMIGLIFEALSLGVALRNLLKEIRQMRAAGVYKYFSDSWNILDFISYTTIIFILPLNIFSYYISTCQQGFWIVPGLNELIAIEVVFLWAELVHFAQGFPHTGALVRIIEMTIWDIRWFMCLQLVLMIGFGTAFTVLFYGQNCVDGAANPEIDGATCNPGYENIYVAMVQMIGLVLGDIAVLDYYNGNSPRPAMTTILMIIYEFLVFVVLFNMLIAIMSESFANVKEVEEVEFLRGRADIICSIEDTMSDARLQDPQLFPKYLHTLQLEEDEELHDAVEAMKGGSKGVTLSLKNMDAEFSNQMQALHREVEDLKSEFTSAMRSTQRAMESANQKLYKKLKQYSQGDMGSTSRSNTRVSSLHK